MLNASVENTTFFTDQSLVNENNDVCTSINCNNTLFFISIVFFWVNHSMLTIFLISDLYLCLQYAKNNRICYYD